MTSFTTREPTPGTVLRDTYEIESVLGRGGMGAVFLARHLRLPGRQVAIKLLHSDEELEPDAYARFRREAEIGSKLGHPNIVQVLDFDKLEDGTPFMVMEYLRGESLARRMRQQVHLPLDATLSITRQIGAALQVAHRAGVVHRDLKPGNIYLVPIEVGGVVTEQVKLLDFGISKLIDSHSVQTQDSVLLGTPRYMSPEQAQGRNRDVDARTDLFSLGCIVYEMLAGRAPFSGSTLPQLIYQIVHERPRPLAQIVPGLPVHVVIAIGRAMAKRPEARYPDVGAFVAELTNSTFDSLVRPAIPEFHADTAKSINASVALASVDSPLPVTARERSRPPTSAIASTAPALKTGSRDDWRPKGLAAAGAGLILGAAAVLWFQPRPSPVRLDAFSGVSDFVRRPRERGARCGKASPFGRGAVHLEGCGGQQRREGRRALTQLSGAPAAFVHARGCREAARTRVPTPRGDGLPEADAL